MGQELLLDQRRDKARLHIAERLSAGFMKCRETNMDMVMTRFPLTGSSIHLAAFACNAMQQRPPPQRPES